MARLTFFIVAMLHLLLLLSPPGTTHSGGNAIFCGGGGGGGVAAMRPLGEKGGEYVTYKPKTSVINQGQGVDGCLPKGIRHSSGPSRYINYRTLGLPSACSTNAPEP
ncbi:unnamed protein product [Lactuca saligna]|uniref:Uncharacterized protein n=1 Tax=Lactuca saligna TaxID=75948 RepID=A0AA35ZQN8_LACSI|nr:unnamed protein product [Lactuca saligna]